MERPRATFGLFERLATLTHSSTHKQQSSIYLHNEYMTNISDMQTSDSQILVMDQIIRWGYIQILDITELGEPK